MNDFQHIDIIHNEIWVNRNGNWREISSIWFCFLIKSVNVSFVEDVSRLTATLPNLDIIYTYIYIHIPN